MQYAVTVPIISFLLASLTVYSKYDTYSKSAWCQEYFST